MNKLLIIFITIIISNNAFAGDLDLPYAKSKYKKIYEKEVGLKMASLCAGNEAWLAGAMRNYGNIKSFQEHEVGMRMYLDFGSVILGSEEKMKINSLAYEGYIKNLTEDEHINLMNQCLAASRRVVSHVLK